MTLIDPFAPTVLHHPRLPLSVHVLPYGLTIHRIVFTDPSTAETHDVITGPEEPKDHHTQGRCFFGPVVGRYANRLPKGENELPGGRGTVNLPEWGGDGICHHGGPESADELPSIPVGTVPPQAGPLDRLIWSRVPSSSSRLFGSESPSTPGSSSAIFAVTSPAGSNGFPGALRIEARIALVVRGMPPQLAGGDDIGGKLGRSAGTVRVEYRAHILDDCKATPVNLTQHWGFNLSASSETKQDKSNKIDDHTIRLIAYPGEDSPGIRRLETDGRGLPTGKLAGIAAGDAHDLTEAGEHGLGRRLGARMPDGGFDHFYVWGFPTFTPPPPGVHPSMVQGPDLTRCILHAPDTRLSLVFRTNQAGVQFYSANGQPPLPAPASQSGGRRKTLHSAAAATSSAEETGSITGARASDEGNAERSAAFLEFGMPHATFLHKELIDALQGHDTVLGPMENYSNWVEVELWKGS